VASIWNKRCYAGDIAVDYYMGVKHKGPGGDEQQRTRDLNAVIFGDGADVNTGYTFIMGGVDGVVTSLLKNGEVVAQAPEVVVPRLYAVHHQCPRLRAEKVGHTLRLYFEGRLAIEYEDPEPIGSGYVGLWTRNSAVCVPRVTIYAESETDSRFLAAP